MSRIDKFGRFSTKGKTLSLSSQLAQPALTRKLILSEDEKSIDASSLCIRNVSMCENPLAYDVINLYYFQEAMVKQQEKIFGAVIAEMESRMDYYLKELELRIMMRFNKKM